MPPGNTINSYRFLRFPSSFHIRSSKKKKAKKTIFHSIGYLLFLRDGLYSYNNRRKGKNEKGIQTGVQHSSCIVFQNVPYWFVYTSRNARTKITFYFLHSISRSSVGCIRESQHVSSVPFRGIKMTTFQVNLLSGFFGFSLIIKTAF